jgi:hypothetical protein
MVPGGRHGGDASPEPGSLGGVAPSERELINPSRYGDLVGSYQQPDHDVVRRTGMAYHGTSGDTSEVWRSHSDPGYDSPEPGDPDPGYPFPSDRPARPGRLRLIALVVLIALVGVVGAVIAVRLSQGGSTPPDVIRVGPTEAPPTAEAPAPGAPTESSRDGRFVTVGQCVRNDGTVAGQPKLVIIDCAPGGYEVLRRIDESTSGERDAEAKCAGVPGYTNWYFYDSDLDTLDFVLCLKLR